MIKKKAIVIFIAALLGCSFSYAQTTELVYSLGKTSSSIEIASVVSDASENIFICGSFTGSAVNFNPLGSDSLRNSNGNLDGFVAKYNSSGLLQKVIAFGNTNIDKANKLCVDASGNVYMAATVISTNIKFDNSGVSFPPTAGAGAMALVKYNNNLVLQVSRLIGKTNGSTTTITGATGDIINDIEVLGTEVYITGMLANSVVNFNQGGGNTMMVNLSPVGSTDIFVAKYDASLLNVWAYNIGGAEGDSGNGIDVDNSGNVYLTGFFRGLNIDIDPNGSVSVSEVGACAQGCSGDAFVAKYNSSMACQWAFNIGSGLLDQGNAILVQKTTGAVYVGGIVKNDALDVEFNPASSTTATFAGVGLNDMFIASYTTAGAYRWHWATGSTGEDNISSLYFDATGNIAFTGFVGGNVTFNNSKSVTGLGNLDVVFGVTESSAGLITDVYNVGGSGNEQGNGVAVTPAGKLLVVGNLSATGDYDPTALTKTITLQGLQDGFITRYQLTSCSKPTSVTITTPATTPTTICQGTAQTLVAATVQSGSSQNGGFYYTWYKGTTAVTTPSTTYANYAGISGLLTDAATYKLRVEDGNTGNAACFTEGSVVINVSATPTITGTTSVCVGSTTTLVGTGTPDATTPWSSATPSVATVNSTGVVTGQSSGTSIVTYKNSFGCTKTVTVTVNPKPSISSSATNTICSGVAQNYTITSAVASNYTWSRPLVSGVTNAAVSGQTANPITETLINNTSNPVSVPYTITPTSTTGSCVGTPFTYTVTVNPSVIPSVSIATPTTIVCAGSSVTFTATPTNGGGTPQYIWNKNGSPVVPAATGVTYTTSTISNNDSYTVTLTSNATCASPTSALSNALVMTVNPNVTPTVSIAASATTICAGGNVTFTPTLANGGATPTYKWKLGSAYIPGATNASYSTTTATNADSYSLEVTSNATCAAPTVVTSSAIVMTVNPTITPSVSITANNTTICAGTSITFTATPVNGGAAPTYKWKFGSAYISGATNATYTTTTAANGDTYSVEMTSNAACASTTPVLSNVITITVTSTVVPVVTISTASNTICAGSSVTFTATPGNGGAAPTFEWFIGATSQGAPSTSATSFTRTNLTNGNQVSVKMVSNSGCASTPNATSNTITMTVNLVETPLVSISTPLTTVCAGASVTFTASPVSGGTSPTYEWFIGSASQGTPSTSATTFTRNNLTNGDLISVKMVSNVACTSSPNATSNTITMVINTITAIISQPSNQSVCTLGDDITFSVGANGTGLTYQWKTGSTTLSNNATYSGVTTKDLLISNVSASELLSYNVVVTGACGVVTSNTASLSQSVSAIVISTQPANQMVVVGDVINLSISATGPALSYQWKKNGIDLVNDSRISGATTSALQITNAVVNDSDPNYTCVITSPCATQVVSSAAVVSVSTTTSIQSAQAKGFTVAPNPSSGYFALSNSSTPFNVERLDIVSMQGVVVSSQSVSGFGQINELINVQNLSSGMYLLIIKGEGQEALVKIAIEK
jgi:hypothetical protein